jgi:tellurite resistance protein
MAVSELRSRVVSTCKKLAATGYAEAAKTLVNDLRPFKGRPLGQLVVELMETVSSADGAVGNRERQVVEFIRKGLGFE